MDIGAINKELEESVNRLQEYRNEFTTDELLEQLHRDLNNSLSEYSKTHKFEDSFDKEFTNDEFDDYIEKLLLSLKPIVDKYSNTHISNIKKEFFKLCAEIVVLNLKQEVIESTIEEVGIQKQDSLAILEVKEAYYEEYQSILEESGVSQDVAKKLDNEFNKYFVQETHKLQMDITAKEVDTEENKILIHTIITDFKEIAHKNYGETITEELLEITTLSALMKLKVIDLQNNPMAIQFEFSKDATPAEIEIMMRKAAKENPYLFENKNIEDMVDEAMAQIESGETYNETAKQLMLLEEQKAELEALKKKFDGLQKEDKPIIEGERDDNTIEKSNLDNGTVIVLIIIASLIFLAYLIMH